MFRKTQFLLVVIMALMIPVIGRESTRLPGDVKVFPVNDLGMHCMDKDFSVLSLLPPFNVLNVQVVYKNPFGFPYLLDGNTVGVEYDATFDPSGSINSWSEGKSNFWLNAQALFGMSLLPGQGLLGFYMPADAPSPGPQEVPFEAQHQWFSAPGIPITPWDDAGKVNTYPMMDISAYEQATGLSLGSTDVVLPISDETDCSQCHGGSGIEPVEQVWRNVSARARAAHAPIKTKHVKPYPNTNTRILRLHDQEQGTSLEASQPVLCAQCHYSFALDLAGTGPSGPQVDNPTMSATMHRFHGNLVDATGQHVIPSSGDMAKTCYMCHPGKKTQCLRGPMAGAGMACFNCHGDMLAVGGEHPLQPGGSIDGTNDGNPRRPWVDMPRCQSCHTGDEVNHLSGSQYKMASDGVRLVQAYRNGDPSASPILASNKRFAENDNTLYRFSKGHGGLMCEACHGSTHAEWPNPNPDANDNVTAMQLQGHTGPIIECNTCHAQGTLPLTVNGPHGLHNVNDHNWYDENHGDYFENNKNACKACHGLDLRGSPLGRAAADRTFVVDTDSGKQTVHIAKGEEVRCNHCHSLPH